METLTNPFVSRMHLPRVSCCSSKDNLFLEFHYSNSAQLILPPNYPILIPHYNQHTIREG